MIALRAAKRNPTVAAMVLGMLFAVAARAEGEDHSFLRRNLHGTSFDASADAAGAVGEQSVQKEQNTMSDVSRVSDVAAVGAVAATAVGEVGMKDKSQADSLEQVAQIEKVAGYASYASGATDIALGAYAFTSHRSRLEKLKKSGADATQVNNAIELTKKAAYSHMLYGAGKLAFGYLNMYLSEQNLKQKKNLESITVENAGTYAATVSNANSATNNSTTSGEQTTGASTDDTASGSAPPPVQATSASVGSDFGGGGGLGSGLKAGSELSAAAKTDASEGGDKKLGEDAKAGGETAAQRSQSEALGGSFEINLGGGGNIYSGGSGSGDSGNPIASIFGGDSGIENANRAPGSVHGDAFMGSGTQSAKDEGVNSGEESLFEIVNRVHERRYAGGGLLGPAQVQVISP